MLFAEHRNALSSSATHTWSVIDAVKGVKRKRYMCSVRNWILRITFTFLKNNNNNFALIFASAVITSNCRWC